MKLLRFRLEIMPVQVRGNGLAIIRVCPDQGFEPGFEEQAENFEPRIHEGFQGISFPRARGSHQEDVKSGVLRVDDFVRFSHERFPFERF